MPRQRKLSWKKITFLYICHICSRITNFLLKVFNLLSLTLPSGKHWMSDDVTVSFDQVVTDNLFSFGPFDVQNTITTTPPHPSIKTRQIIFYLLFAPLSIFKSLYRLFPRVKSILFVLLVPPWRQATSTF